MAYPYDNKRNRGKLIIPLPDRTMSQSAQPQSSPLQQSSQATQGMQEVQKPELGLPLTPTIKQGAPGGSSSVFLPKWIQQGQESPNYPQPTSPSIKQAGGGPSTPSKPTNIYWGQYNQIAQAQRAQSLSQQANSLTVPPPPVPLPQSNTPQQQSTQTYTPPPPPQPQQQQQQTQYQQNPSRPSYNYTPGTPITNFYPDRGSTAIIDLGSGWYQTNHDTFRAWTPQWSPQTKLNFIWDGQTPTNSGLAQQDLTLRFGPNDMNQINIGLWFHNNSLVVQQKWNPEYYRNSWWQPPSSGNWSSGYSIMQPVWSTPLPQLQQGQQYSLGYTINGNQMTVTLNDQPVWIGNLSPEAMQWLVGTATNVRADNALVRYNLSMG